MRAKLFGLGIVALLAIGGYVEHVHHASARQTAMNAIDPSKAVMKPSPIRSECLEGVPKTLAGEVAATDDGSTKIYVWQTTAGRFNWIYDFDEVITILDGDVFITDPDGRERHLRAGDVAFFPVGARTTWRVPDHLRKVAVVKGALPSPVASAMRIVRAAKQMVKPSAAMAGE